MGKPGSRQISDPVHGTVEFSELEVRIVDTRAFQRLHNVKQLGLAHYVFPGAGYSRFSHSLGACHVMARIMEVLRKYDGSGFLTEDQIRLYRVAALLHDLGHYPFSHATEYAFQNHYRSTLLQSGEVGVGAEPKADVGPAYVNHESVGGLLLEKDPEIPAILKQAGINPEDVENIIRRQAPVPLLSNLISSDLDADRLDYLLRTAHHAGLPYGNVDLGYILSQLRLDEDGRVCITQKAVGAADHMLMCRYFDYQQVTFHKVVQGLEWVLKGCVSDLVQSGRLDGSRPEVQRKIETGEWAEFDDGYLINLVRAQRSAGTPDERLRATAVLDRRPPVVLARNEDIDKATALLKRPLGKLFRRALIDCAARFDIPEDRFNLWEPSPLTLTKIGGHVDVSAIADAGEKKRDHLEQAVRVLDENGHGSSPIQSQSRSLMSVLSDFGVRPLRLYALLSPKELEREDEMRAFVQKAIEPA